jgi:DNA-binding NarL/FixJ family response regulator
MDGHSDEESQSPCFKLTRAQRQLLEACLIYRTVDSRTLGNFLFVAPSTIRSHFKTLTTRAEVHDRFAMVLFALEQGIIALPWDENITR